MNSRELLEAAAKAGGIGPIRGFDYGDPGSRDMAILVDAGRPAPQRWNSLGNDRDALWLAVQLRMCVSVNDDHTSIDCSEGWVAIHQAHEGDPMAATRLAITRAAASISTKGDGHG